MRPPSDGELLAATSKMGSVRRDAAQRVIGVDFDRDDCLFAVAHIGRYMVAEENHMVELVAEGDKQGGCRMPVARSVFCRLSQWGFPASILAPLIIRVDHDDFELLSKLVWLLDSFLLPPQENAAEKPTILRHLAATRALLTHLPLLTKLKALLLKCIETRGLSEDGTGGLSRHQQEFVSGALDVVVAALRLPDLSDARGSGTADNLFDRIVTAFDATQFFDVLQLFVYQNLTDAEEKARLLKEQKERRLLEQKNKKKAAAAAAA
eukprot:Rhum_TRINITY_DN12005_c2_g1::Rhum_TRINITY_DN12005_c2_g1_i1::g.48632::m.48632